MAPITLASSASTRAAQSARSASQRRLSSTRRRPVWVAASQQPAPEGDAGPSSSRKLPDTTGKLMMNAFASEEEWRILDKKVNKYPGQRTFTAIGTGGTEFKAAMLEAVESVVGSVHVECVADRPSSGGKYISVRIGPVWVRSADEVVAVFDGMRKDTRLKWFM